MDGSVQQLFSLGSCESYYILKYHQSMTGSAAHFYWLLCFGVFIEPDCSYINQACCWKANWFQSQAHLESGVHVGLGGSSLKTNTNVIIRSYLLLPSSIQYRNRCYHISQEGRSIWDWCVLPRTQQGGDAS